MYITFEEADKIREALKPGATQDKRYEAIAILDVAEKKQHAKNEKSMAYIQAKRKEDKSYARPKESWVITMELPEGKKILERVGDFDEIRAKIRKEYPDYISLRARLKKGKKD